MELFQLNSGGVWEKKLNVEYQDEEESLSYPIGYYINSANDFLVVQTDGVICSYSTVTGEQNEKSTDFQFDVSCVTFCNGMGYILNEDEDQVIAFDDTMLSEEYIISLSVRLSGGGSMLASGMDDILIVFNKAGIFISELQKQEFERISSADVFNSVSIDYLYIREMTAVNRNEFYVSMYKTDSENHELNFARCKGI